MSLEYFLRNYIESFGDEVCKNEIDILIAVGKDSKYISGRAKELGMEDVYEFDTNKEAIEKLNEILVPNDAVLLKASNGMRFTEILEDLRRK